MSRSRLWLVSCVAAIVVFAVPLLVASAVAQSDPEIRLPRTGDSISALIVTEDERILVINSNARGTTRSAVGHLARPWEPLATILLAPADDDAAIGLWEALRDPRIQQAIVIGVPGSNPIWSRIERDCAQRGVELTYVSRLSHVELAGAALTIQPTGMTVSMHSGDAVVAVALSSQPVSVAANVTVVNDLATMPHETDLVIAPSFPNEDMETPVVRVNDREIVRLVFEPTTIRIQGGSVQRLASGAN